MGTTAAGAGAGPHVVLLSAFAVAQLADAVLNFYIGGFGVLLGQFGTSALGLSEATISLIMVSGALSAAVDSMLAGRLIPKYIDRLVMIVSLLILAASSIVMLFATPTMPIWVLTLVYVLVACSIQATGIIYLTPR